MKGWALSNNPAPCLVRPPQTWACPQTVSLTVSSLQDMATGNFWVAFCLSILTSFSSASLELAEKDSSRLQSNQPDDDVETASSRSLSIVNYNTDLKVGEPIVDELPTSIEVRSDSNLYIQPGQPAIINFEVTNHKYSQMYYYFDATSSDIRIVDLQPQRSYVASGSSVLVRVTAGGRGTEIQSYSSVMTFAARWSSSGNTFREESVIKKVYIRSGRMPSDSSRPSISYTYNGDCGGYTEPKNCQEKFWRADITAQDSDAGILMLKSFPVGLILNKEFIVGTTEEVNGYYKANCCLTKVDITAKDVYGNEKTLHIDIERIWLATGEIIAIVLGCILLIILIILLVLCIIRLCRRRRSLSIYPESRSI